MYNLPKHLACPHCGFRAEYEYARQLICVNTQCNRKFWVWDAKFFGIETGFDDCMNRSLSDKLREIRLFHELG